MFFHTCKQQAFTWGQVWRVRRMCQHLPAPLLHSDFAHHNGDEVLHGPGAKWCHAQVALVVYSEESGSPHPARVHGNFGHWLSYQLAWDGQVQVHFGWRTWVLDFQSTLTVCCAISSLVTFGHAILHSLVSAEGQMNASMTHQLLHCSWGMHCFHFSNSADGRRQEEHAWLFARCWAHVESTLHKLFVSPSCWWGYGEILTSVAFATYEILRVHSGTDFACSMWCLSVADVRPALHAWYVFPAILTGHHPSVNSFVWGSLCP